MEVVLKLFSANIIENQKLAFPVKIELLDSGLNPLFETIATGKDEDGNYLFSDDRYITGAVAQLTPFSVRFTVGDKSFVKDLPT